MINHPGCLYIPLTLFPKTKQTRLQFMTTRKSIAFISSLTAGIITCFCFIACRIQNDAPETCPTKNEKTSQSFQHRIDSLYEQTQLLQSTLTATEILLSKTRKQNKQLRATVFAQSIKAEKDRNAHNDSLKETVMTWPVAIIENDSLY